MLSLLSLLSHSLQGIHRRNMIKLDMFTTTANITAKATISITASILIVIPVILDIIILDITIIIVISSYL